MEGPQYFFDLQLDMVWVGVKMILGDMLLTISRLLFIVWWYNFGQGSVTLAY